MPWRYTSWELRRLLVQLPYHPHTTHSQGPYVGVAEAVLGMELVSYNCVSLRLVAWGSCLVQSGGVEIGFSYDGWAPPAVVTWIYPGQPEHVVYARRLVMIASPRTFSLRQWIIFGNNWIKTKVWAFHCRRSNPVGVGYGLTINTR